MLGYFEIGLTLATPSVDLGIDLDPTPDTCLFCDALLVEDETEFCAGCLDECGRDDAADRAFDSQVEDGD